VGRRAQTRKELRVLRAARRAAGELRGTHGLTLLPALRAQLDERGWSARRFRRVPAGEGHGRPWGAPDRGFRGQVVLQLPDDVARVVEQGAYWTSLPHVRRLQALAEGSYLSRAPVSQPLLETKRALAAKVVTAHDVLREAIRQTCENAPEQPSSHVTLGAVNPA
jgi:hypothetical protein